MITTSVPAGIELFGGFKFGDGEGIVGGVDFMSLSPC